MAGGFQASTTNPLVGLEGRVALLKRLGRAMKGAPQIFGTGGPRLRNIFGALRAGARPNRAEAPPRPDLGLPGVEGELPGGTQPGRGESGGAVTLRPSPGRWPPP